MLGVEREVNDEMSSYKLMVEGVFVYAQELAGDIGRFHTTFFLQASNASNAVYRVCGLLAARIGRHGIAESGGVLFKSYYWAHDIWEITEDQVLQGDSKDSGFTFFHIRWYEKAYLSLMGIYFNRFKPWVLIKQAG